MPKLLRKQSLSFRIRKLIATKTSPQLRTLPPRQSMMLSRLLTKLLLQPRRRNKPIR